MEYIVKYCTERLSDEKLLGYMNAPWRMTYPENRQILLDSMDKLGKAKKWFSQQ